MLNNNSNIIFGEGQIAQLPNHIPKDKTVVLCYSSGSLKETQVYSQIKTALKGYRIREFGGIESSPDYDTLMKAVTIVKGEGPENCFILAVGGGSVCDGSKFIALASMYNGSDAYNDLLEKQGAGIHEAVPIGVIMTVSSTGSESTSCCIITCRRTEKRFCVDNPRLLPRFAILDPSISTPLPYGDIANEMMDTFVHVCEQYVEEGRHIQERGRSVKSLLRILAVNEELSYPSQTTENDREDIMWATNHVLNHLIAQSVPSD